LVGDWLTNGLVGSMTNELINGVTNCLNVDCPLACWPAGLPGLTGWLAARLSTDRLVGQLID